MYKLLVLLFLTTATVGLVPNHSFAQTQPASKILSGVSDESDYYKFASLVRSANMDATLAALGTYTVFAPDNVIFRNMPSNQLDSLTGPANLTTLIKAHIVKGKITSADIIKRLAAGKDKTTLTNLLGQPLRLSRTKGNKLLLTDIKGNQVHFLAFDIKDPHAVVFGIDNILATSK